MSYTGNHLPQQVCECENGSHDHGYPCHRTPVKHDRIEYLGRDVCCGPCFDEYKRLGYVLAGE